MLPGMVPLTLPEDTLQKGARTGPGAGGHVPATVEWRQSILRDTIQNDYPLRAEEHQRKGYGQIPGPACPLRPNGITMNICIPKGTEATSGFNLLDLEIH